MRYAKVIGNIVVNVINDDKILSSPWIASETAQIGYIYDPETGKFSAPYTVLTRKIPTTDFIMRVPIDKRIAMKKIDDPYVIDWMQLLYDPRLYEIELESPELIDALNYMVARGYFTQQEVAVLLR